MPWKVGRRSVSNTIIIITGFSGTGKSRVGRAVAQLLGWELVDTDEMVVRQAGKPIARIFQDEGEDAFRRMERQALE
ncbi:MAG: hypothetical protein HY531_03465, partial [Chloroflexi bacterium]|nr:hypothetical protein [Chloroflexota bacterium]